VYRLIDEYESSMLIDQHPSPLVVILPLYFVTLWLLIGTIISRVPHTFAFFANVWALRSDGTLADHDDSSMITRCVPNRQLSA